MTVVVWNVITNALRILVVIHVSSYCESFQMYQDFTAKITGLEDRRKRIKTAKDPDKVRGIVCSDTYPSASSDVIHDSVACSYSNELSDFLAHKSSKDIIRRGSFMHQYLPFCVYFSELAYFRFIVHASYSRGRKGRRGRKRRQRKG